MSSPLPAPSSRFAQVATLGGAPGTWTYRVPSELADEVKPGRRVLVPFGSRRRAGIVISCSSTPPEDELKLKDIEQALDDAPLLTPEVLKLITWACDYYASPLGMALRAALPPGAEVEEKLTPVVTEAGKQALHHPSTPPSLQAALRVLTGESGKTDGKTAAPRPEHIRRLAANGWVELRSQVRTGASVPMVDLVRRRAAADTVIPEHHKLQLAVWKLLKEQEPIALELLSSRIPGSRDAVRRMVRRGLLEIESVPRERASPEVFGPVHEPPELTQDQEAALRVLLASLDKAEQARGNEGELPAPFLLHGVTGSGKTEVYLKLIAEVRKRGQSALVLVPEIALTPQLAGRFRARFGNSVAVLHSGLKERDRLSEWHRVRRGDAPIVVGARSAVFAPVQNLGAIIVDEEHDGSFKQEQGLRYNGRDLAVVRSRLARAIIVLGSATPSLESLHNSDLGRYTRLLLPSRVDSSRPMPEVELVDLRERKIEKSTDTIAPSHLLSPRLVTALQETIERGEQAIVFLNRRGHSTVVLCRDCGHSLACDHCSVALTWHERGRRLVCHYCNLRRGVPDLCENCQGSRLLFAGAGTEKLEEELNEALPKARIGRLDRDTAATSARLERLLMQFSQGDLDVLVGTQMVAKGHDFPNVTLVCVLLADSGLNQPDFRAAERTAQLLTQVAGRAGRGELPGRVLVQTFNPESTAIAASNEHDYEGFARSELPEREALFYPPFSRLCLIRIDGEREAEARTVSTVLARQIRDAEIPGLHVLGPAPSALERLRGRYRFQILMKAAKPSILGAGLRAMRKVQHRIPAAVRVAVDVDPVDML